MSRRLRPTKFKRLQNIFKHRFMRPLVVALLFAIIGSLLIFLSYADEDDENFPGVAPNPQISSQSCVGGLNIALVADVSGSIVGQPQSFRQMQAAFRDFVSALLPSTQTYFSVTEFGTRARVIQPFTKDVSQLNSAIESFTKNTNARTNWPAGLDAGFSTFSGAAPNAPRLLVIATDGDPSMEDVDDYDLMVDSINSANAIKNGGVHILALGFDGNNGSPDVNNLRLISGNRVNTGGVNADVVTTGIDNMSATLQEIARNTCVTPMPPPPPPTGTGGIGDGNGGNGTGVGGIGDGNGTGGTGTGSNGTGTGTGGRGSGSGGRGVGSAGNGIGQGPGTTAQPSPTPVPTASGGTTPSPAPTNIPNQEPTPAPVAMQSPEPDPAPAPTPTAQGTRTRPPDQQPSPFFDGKQFAPGTIEDDFTFNPAKRGFPAWGYGIIAGVIALAGGGYYVWRKYFRGAIGSDSKPASKTTGKAKKSRKGKKK